MAHSLRGFESQLVPSLLRCRRQKHNDGGKLLEESGDKTHSSKTLPVTLFFQPGPAINTPFSSEVSSGETHSTAHDPVTPHSCQVKKLSLHTGVFQKDGSIQTPTQWVRCFLVLIKSLSKATRKEERVIVARGPSGLQLCLWKLFHIWADQK